MARYGHSCNTMKINGILHVVVAGGETGKFTPKRNYKILNSVELLDPTSPNERSFDLGPRLPFRLTRATMMTSIIRKSVIVIGGSKTNGFDDNSVNNTLLELSGNSKDSLKWTVQEQKLQFSFALKIAIIIMKWLVRLAPIGASRGETFRGLLKNVKPF